MAIAPIRRAGGHADAFTIHAVGDVGAVRLVWREVPGADGYLIHGAPWEDGAMWQPDLANLLGTVRDPRFVHDRLGPAATRWSYLVQPIPGVEHRGARVMAQSLTSAVLTGTPIATVGDFGAHGAGSSLAPEEFALYRSRFPRDVDFRIGYDRPESTWSRLHPGPDDAWAARREHRFRLRFDLDRLPDADVDLAIWLIDRHPAHAGSLTVAVNEVTTGTVFFDDAGDDSRRAAPVVGAALRGAGPAYIERVVPRERLRTGENTVDLIKDHGCWIAYDAVGLFAR